MYYVNLKKLLLLAAVGTLFSNICLAAGAPTASTPPDANANPILANIQKMGAKAYYMGNRNGLDGWFIVKDGQVQIAYATPDNKGAVVGAAMFGPDGENVTVMQVGTLIQTNTEVASLIEKIKKEQAAMTPVGSPPAASAASPASPNTLPSASLSPGDRLMHDLGTASTIVIGNPNTPEILMVMDPHCPHCQATWKALHDAVIAGTLHLRMIPIAPKDSDNERAAAILLTSTDPLNTWDKYVAGDKSQLVGTPTQAALDAVRANHVVTDSWKIMDTPYMVYRAKDNKVKIVVGEPANVATLKNDLGL